MIHGKADINLSDKVSIGGVIRDFQTLATCLAIAISRARPVSKCNNRMCVQYGLNPLILAATFSKAEVAMELIKAKADVNQADKKVRVG